MDDLNIRPPDRTLSHHQLIPDTMATSSSNGFYDAESDAFERVMAESRRLFYQQQHTQQKCRQSIRQSYHKYSTEFQKMKIRLSWMARFPSSSLEHIETAIHLLDTFITLGQENDSSVLLPSLTDVQQMSRQIDRLCIHLDHVLKPFWETILQPLCQELISIITQSS